MSSLAQKILEMTADMDLRYDRSIAESMLLDVILEAKVQAKLEAAQQHDNATASKP